MAVKHYSMNAHQTFVVVESGQRVFSVKCPNSNEGMVREDASISISLIQERISGQFNYKVSYRKAWKAKQKAIERVYGDWSDSYDLLPRWLDRMVECCPGSVYKLETTEYVSNNIVDPNFRQFRRVFWTFKPACDAFNYTKPIIQIDGTFLYGKYRGTLLIATTQDGNARVLPLAFAIVEGETLSDWSWFLSNIRRYVTRKQGYTTNKHRFERRLERFREVSPEICRWIDGISLEKWAIAHDEEGRRYGHMTTNLSEAVNKVLKGARNLPITALVKCTYARLVEYFIQRLGQANADLALGKRYCQKLMDAMETNQQEATSHFVRRYDYESTRFEVEEIFNAVTQRGGKVFNVFLNERKCECGAFQAYRYPCSHAIAACAHVRIDPLTFVDAAYTNEYIKAAYSGQWFPLGSEENIQPTNGPRIVPDETMIRTKGRPKSTRIRNEMDWTESQRRQRCGHCRREGHNRTNCPVLAEDVFNNA
ncbi:uncharacterized protein LOC109809280 [Cajanus cajan]|uniref:uncharacterized protein LOC109809280 n=1 Tax=Cajanus cajan TaxID=3821 RepID=UPI00098DC05F|nr:uncharacterized protein LOC109809280 [Cajanus cajan]